MTIIYTAATLPVNPPDVPRLTSAQLWKGLDIKVRKPQLFIPAKTCEVLEENKSGILREVVFLDLPGLPTGITRERITRHAPLEGSENPTGVITFVTQGGKATKVLNIVSIDAEGELFLTFTFEWDHPEIEAGSAEEVEKANFYRKTGPGGVASTLAGIRKLLESGEL